MKFLALILAVSLVTTAMPATATPTFASEGAQEVTSLATDGNAEAQCEGFYLESVNSSSLDLMIGENGRFEVKPNFYKGTKSVYYQWSYLDYDSYEYVDIPGANTASIDVTGVKKYVEYRVDAKDECGHSDYLYFFLYHKSGIEFSNQKTYYDVLYGESVTMTVNAVDKNPGASIVSYQWYKQNGVEIKSATSNKYTVTANDYQKYYCVVKDSIGDEARIDLYVDPTVGLKVEADNTSYNVVSGGSQSLSVKATTELEGVALSYQWSVYNKSTHKWDDIAGANANTYVAAGITANTNVKCTVTALYNDLGQNSSITFELNVTKYGLNVKGYTYSRLVKAGTPVTFTATAGSGTVVAEYYDSSTGEEKQVTKGADNTFSFTPMSTGYIRFYIKEDRDEDSNDRYFISIYIFDVVGTITIGQPVTITPSSSNGKYGGYELTTTQTGKYSIITYDESKGLYLVCEDGYTEWFRTYKEDSDDMVFKTTVYLDANKKYYIIDANTGEYVWDDEIEDYIFIPAEPYAITITNDIHCEHSNTKVKNAKAATCTEVGYTGDIYCKDCDVLVAAGAVIPALGHTTTVVNAKAATCTEAGYTGDKVCTVCNATVEAGTVIPTLGHATTVVNAKAATCTEAGYTGDKVCSVCNATVEAGTVIPATGHTESVINAKPATMSEDGYTGDKVCSVCNETIEAGTAIAKIKFVTLRKTILTYTGKNQKPVVVVKDRTGKIISADNYTVSYSKDIKSIGVKTVKVEFEGNYSGTKTLTYKIAPENTSKLTVKAGKKSINVSWKKQDSQTTGYQIQYSTKKNFAGAKTITVKKNSITKTTIKSFKKGTTYYVRIRTYKTVNKKAVASNWSSAKKVKVTK